MPLPHSTDAVEPLNDTVRDEDSLRTQDNGLTPRQQSFHSEQRRVLFCQYHSESDIPSLASRPPLYRPFSSTIEVQRQNQWRSPHHSVISVLPSHRSATFSANQRPHMGHSTILDNSRVDGVTPTTRIATRAEDHNVNVSPVMRYPPPEEFGNEMCEWSANGTEAREHVNNSWKGETSAKAVLMFTGLFSPIVASFIIESYKMLSSDPGDSTSRPSCQISKGLTGVTSDTAGSLQASSTPPPAASLVCVNILWLLSLVLSIASALFATLGQQWAPKCNRLPQVAMTVALLHLSSFLFLNGLVVFFFAVYKTVAIVVSIVVGLFVMLYLSLTVLACVDRNFPYRTPLSGMRWFRRD